MRAVITGCAGFLGSSLSERLLVLGHDVIGIDCFTDYYPRARKELNMVSLRDQEAFTFREIDLAADPLTTAVGAVSTNNQSASRSVGSAQVGSASASAPTRVASSGKNGSTSYGSGANNQKPAVEDSAGSAQVGSVNVDAPVRAASDGDNARDA